MFLWRVVDPAADIGLEDIVVANHNVRKIDSLYGLPVIFPISRRSLTAVKMTSIGPVMSYGILAISSIFSRSFLVMIFLYTWKRTSRRVKMSVGTWLVIQVQRRIICLSSTTSSTC